LRVESYIAHPIARRHHRLAMRCRLGVMMKNRFDTNTIIKRNPKVDEKQFFEAQKQIRELRAAGHEPKKYNIESPFKQTFWPCDAMVASGEAPSCDDCDVTLNS
jgi:hypothetical protein